MHYSGQQLARDNTDLIVSNALLLTSNGQRIFKPEEKSKPKDKTPSAYTKETRLARQDDSLAFAFFREEGLERGAVGVILKLILKLIN